MWIGALEEVRYGLGHGGETAFVNKQEQGIIGRPGLSEEERGPCKVQGILVLFFFPRDKVSPAQAGLELLG